MKKIFCDRCNKEINPVLHYGSAKKLIMELPTYAIREVYANKEPRELDICQDCKKELKAWLEEFYFSCDERRCEICKHFDCLGKKCMHNNIHVDLNDICNDFSDKRDSSICDDCLYKDKDHNTCVIADNWGISCDVVTTCPNYKRGVRK